MQQDPGSAEPRSLEEARQVIARQAEEIERLRRRLGDDRFAEELRDALSLAATAGTIAAPVVHSRLLEMIVETAADVIDANAASLFLIDYDTQELVFEVTLGEKAEEVRKFRVPLGHGVAGLVALSGQPMAVSDTATDNRDAAEIAEAVGYIPKNILCVPLFYDDQVIGVIELLDKQGAPSFNTTDMESLGRFANQAAVAIEQSRNQQNLAALIGEVLASFGGIPELERQGLRQQAQAFATGLEANPAHRRALALARLVQEIARSGESESNACQGILESFAAYLRSHPALTSGEESLW